jgi:23S rRNA (uracil1939-C5)-methyltransferase
MRSDDLLTGEITGMAFGGSGILKMDGFVVFVPFTVPGDRIVCRIIQRKKNFAFGELVELLQPGPERIQPLCPYFGTCGGCQLQQMTYTGQLEHKRQVVEDALKRMGRLNIQTIPRVVPSEAQWAYRRHITLSLRPNHEGTLTAGYIALDQHSLLSIQQCPIFAAPENPIISKIQRLVHTIKTQRPNEGRVIILKHPNGQNFILSFHFQSLPPQAPKQIEDFLSRDPSITGIAISAPGYFKGWGNTLSRWDIEGLTIEFHPGAFIQNHPEQSLNIYKAIVEMAKGIQDTHVLDLYCGIGITSLMLARLGKKVLGVESNPEAIRQANANARLNAVTGVEFMVGDVKKVLPQIIKDRPAELIIINPPREGMEKKVVQILLENPAQELIYISCMPSTLARDLKELCEKKYRLDYCQAYDMFPQTGHVETLVRLCRNHD